MVAELHEEEVYGEVIIGRMMEYGFRMDYAIGRRN